MAISIPNILKSAGRYSAAHPKVLGQIARAAFQRRLAIPLDSLRWLVRELPQNKSAPKDITLVSQDPALGLGLSVDLMGTELRIDLRIFLDHLYATADSLQVTMRVKDLRASVLNNLEGNVAKMLKSGFFDLSKPANLVNSPMLGGKKPAAIVDAKDDLFVIDLMRVPNIAKNPTIQRALATLTPILSVSDIRTQDDMLLIGLRAKPKGLRESFAGLRS